MMSLTSWAQGLSKADLALCTAFNFGYTGDLPMSQISLDTSNDKHPNMDIGTLGMRAARRCSIVIISGKFISDIDNVMDVIKDISEDTITMPLIVFLMEGPDSDQQSITFNISTRNHNSPIVVRLFYIHISIRLYRMMSYSYVGFCSILQRWLQIKSPLF